MAIDLKQFMNRFVREAKDHIAAMNDGLLNLEANPGDTETLAAVFRSAHTIKGSSRMMKLGAVSDFAHEMEEVLDALRSGRIPLTGEVSGPLFAALDVLSGMVAAAGGGPSPVDPPETLVEALRRVARGDAAESTGNPEPVRPPAPKDPSVPPPAARESGANAASPAASSQKKTFWERRNYETIRVDMGRLDDQIKLIGELVTGQGRIRKRVKECRTLRDTAFALLRRMDQDGGSPPSGTAPETLLSMRSLEAGLRGLLMRLERDIGRQDPTVAALRDGALNMRMRPLSTLFDTYRRTVRDLGESLGKKVRLAVEGGETEIDRKMIEQLGDPLFHMIRNSVDHGIESPEERLAAGKPETGTITLSACYEGEHALVRLSDDGAGLSREKIRAAALRKGLMSAEELARLSETELLNLIFLPGFSTSGIITDISGRGVGMDVVKKQVVDLLKGTVQVGSEEGTGTVFTFRLLPTLAVMQVVLVRAGGMIFAFPAGFVSEVIGISERETIEVPGRRAVRLREQIVPMVSLAETLGLPDETRGDGRDLLVLIVTSDREQTGFVVDAILNTEEVVIKPLPSHMAGVRFVSGVIISDGGEIVNVLNPGEIVAAAGEKRRPARTEHRMEPEVQVIRILVADDSVNTREIEKSILESWGYDVTLAGDGVEALRKAEETQYDVVVTDVEMPRMDGFTLTENLRKMEAYRDTPVILVTSLDREEDKKRGIRAGADAYIIKGSFDQTDLVDTIKSLIGR